MAPLREYLGGTGDRLVGHRPATMVGTIVVSINIEKQLFDLEPAPTGWRPSASAIVTIRPPAAFGVRHQECRAWRGGALRQLLDHLAMAGWVHVKPRARVALGQVVEEYRRSSLSTSVIVWSAPTRPQARAWPNAEAARGTSSRGRVTVAAMSMAEAIAV